MHQIMLNILSKLMLTWPIVRIANDAKPKPPSTGFKSFSTVTCARRGSSIMSGDAGNRFSFAVALLHFYRVCERLI